MSYVPVRADPASLSWERLLPRVGGAVSRLHHRLLARHGLTPTALALLEALERGAGPAHRDLAAALGLTPATLTPVVDALVRDGWVVRARERPDRRVVRLSITPAGRVRCRTAAAQVRAALCRALPPPPPDRADDLRDYLVAVLTAVAGEPP